MSSVLSNIRRECADEIEALAFFNDIPVICEDKGDIDADITRALAPISGAKSGAFVIFMTRGASVKGSAEFGPVFGEILLEVECMEFKALNRATSGTGKTAWEMVEQVAAALINFKPASANGPVALEDPTILPQAVELGGGMVLEGFSVRMSVPGSLAIVKTQVATPAAAVDAGEVTLTCATAGAAIFYTTDGKKPGPNYGTLYSVPFSPGAGTVKARAWLSGFLASEIRTQAVT